MSVRLSLGAMVLVTGIVLVVFFLQTILSIFRKKPDEIPPLGRLSTFAVLSFLSGLVVLGLVVAVIILTFCQRYDLMLGLAGPDFKYLALTQTILLYCSIAPALAAIGFALGARGSISEGQGAVRGKAYYRAGVLMSFLSGLTVLAA